MQVTGSPEAQEYTVLQYIVWMMATAARAVLQDVRAYPSVQQPIIQSGETQAAGIRPLRDLQYSKARASLEEWKVCRCIVSFNT